MTLNLNKNRDGLLAAWKDVLDDKTSTNWALFSYEGLSNDLKVVSKGSGGIEELTEDLNSGKIMYAFLQVMDPKTSLPKNVLINWQGEGVPNVRKGTCANHFREVSNFFKGAHVTMSARTEEEVDSQIIIEKVSKSTGSMYSFKERAEHVNETGPVGTSYKRVIPKQEINAQERDRFWEKEEQEEKQRQEEERRRKDEERKNLEEERKKRETEEAALREAKIKERTRSINQIREAEKVTHDRVQTTREDIVEDMEREEKERKERAEILRRQRSEEAQQLISKRTIDARAVFERNTSAGQLTTRRASYQPNGLQKAEETNVKVSEEPSSVPAVRKGSLPTWLPETENKKPTETSGNIDNTIKSVNGNEQKEKVTQNVVEENLIEEEQDWEDEVKHDIPITQASVLESHEAVINENAAVSKHTTEFEYLNGDTGLTARALYDYQAADDTEITFDPGDIITHIDTVDEGWWQGVGPDGVYGLFPANYVELLN